MRLYGFLFGCLAAVLVCGSQDSFAQGLCFGSAIGYGGDGGERGVVSADLNFDGHADLAIANQSTHNVSVLHGNGDGTFGSPLNYSVLGDPTWLTVQDFDLDDDMDIAVTSQGTFTYACVLKNDGSGMFPTRYDLPNGNGTEGPYSICAAKLDADLDYDIATTNTGADSISVFMNNGDGTFAPAVKYPSGGALTTITAADLDGDDDIDLAAGEYTHNMCNVFLNNGSGTFAGRTDYPTASDPWGICASDIDGDGDQDLALASAWAAVSVLRNNGDGTFPPRVDYPTGTVPCAITATDLNQDGRPDLAVADEAGPIWVLKNTGGGGFAAAQNVGVGGGGAQHAICSGLFDADAKHDLAVQSGPSVSVLLNCFVPCICPCPADPVCDGTRSDISDVVTVINVAFRGIPDTADPTCPRSHTDVDASGASDVIDVTKVINVAFRGQPVATNYVDPCAP